VGDDGRGVGATDCVELGGHGYGEDVFVIIVAPFLLTRRTDVRPAHTVGILQYKPIQSAKYCNLIGQLRATELDYIVKCPQ